MKNEPKMRHAKAIQIHRSTKILRAVQLLLGDRKPKGTVRSLGIEAMTQWRSPATDNR